MLFFTKIRYKNFMSAGNDFIEIPLDTPGITICHGQNGHGKSSIIEAIVFALYGKPYRDINKIQLINSINAKEALVEIEFQIYKKKYLVRRGIKPNSFNIFCNGKPMAETIVDAREQQQWFEEHILKIDYKTFIQVVILSVTNFIPFLSLPLATRRYISEDLLQLRPFSTMNVIAKQEYSELNEKKKALDFNITLTEKTIETFKRASEDAKKNITEIIELKRNQIGLQLEEIQRKRSQINSVITLRSKIKDPRPKLDKNNSHKKELYESLGKLLFKLDSNKANLKFFSENDECPKCNQAIVEEHKHSIEESISAEILFINSLIDDVQANINKIDNNIKICLNEQDEINDLTRDIKLLENEIFSHENNVRIFNKEIESLGVSHTVTTKDQISKLLVELDTYEKNKVEILDELKVYDVILRLLKDDGIKSQIIKHYIPIINKIINEYLGLFDFFIGFEFDENFKETIKSRHRDQYTYESFSEGEKSRIDLSLLFTWRDIASLRNSVKTNLLILDEILDSSMDINGIDALFEMLAKKQNSTIIISHKDSFMEKANKNIRFEKTGNFSEITID